MIVSGSCEAQAGEKVSALSGRQQWRQVLLCSGCSPDQRSSTLVNLKHSSNLVALPDETTLLRAERCIKSGCTHVM